MCFIVQSKINGSVINFLFAFFAPCLTTVDPNVISLTRMSLTAVIAAGLLVCLYRKWTTSCT